MTPTAETVRIAAVQMIPVNRLTFDLRVQRHGGVLPARMKHLTSSWDLDMIGILTASERPDGRIVCLDGMHRATVMSNLGFGDWEIPVNLYRGLSLAQEAAIFRSLNDGAKPSPFDNYVTGVVAGDPECCGIDRVVQARGLTVVSSGTGDATIRAVNALRAVYRGAVGPIGRPGHERPELLGAVLDVSTAAWGTGYASYEGQVLHGLGIAIAHGGDALDTRSLTQKLSSYKGGAAGVLGRARMLREVLSATVTKCVADIAVTEYNRGKRAGRLPPL